MRKSTWVLQEDVGRASGSHGTVRTQRTFSGSLVMGDVGSSRSGASPDGMSKEGVLRGGEVLGGGRVAPAGRVLNRVPPEWYVRLLTPEPAHVSPFASRVFAGVGVMRWFR